jgi:uncharacterized protein
MGHRDSSAQLGRNGAVFVAGGGAAGPAAQRAAAGRATAIGSAARSIGAWALLFAIRFYIVLLSPVFGGACKFQPSCSNYAYAAVARHGARRGAALAVKRLLRCRPFTRGGFDPVPDDLSSATPDLSLAARSQASATGAPEQACISVTALLRRHSVERMQ